MGWRVIVRASRSADSTSVGLSCLSAIAQTRERNCWSLDQQDRRILLTPSDAHYSSFEMILVLELLSIGVGMLGALTGFSTKFYFFTHMTLVRRDRTYQTLLQTGEVSEPALIRELLKFVREDVSKVDSPGLAQYGLMRRWKEVVKLRFEPGRIDQREEYRFVGINPIYGYDVKGEEVLVADKNSFHQLYLSRFSSLQQKTAFRILLVAFLLQLLAALVP